MLWSFSTHLTDIPIHKYKYIKRAAGETLLYPIYPPSMKMLTVLVFIGCDNENLMNTLSQTLQQTLEIKENVI